MSPTAYRSYQAFKYTVYALLTLNIYLFFAEEWAASGFRTAGDLGPGDVLEAFAATIDTAAWVVLLLLFELETWTLDDRVITPRVRAVLTVSRAVCYTVIVAAFFGYLGKLLALYAATPMPNVDDLCELAGSDWSYAVGLDDFVALTIDNCATYPGDEIRRLGDSSAVVAGRDFAALLRLAWADVINSAAWLLVVALLEIDVQLQEQGRLRGRLLRASNLAKYALYAVLFAAAVYWGVAGEFIDFWDAFLWLLAFAFIELNIFEWRRETGAP